MWPLSSSSEERREELFQHSLESSTRRLGHPRLHNSVGCEQTKRLILLNSTAFESQTHGAYHENNFGRNILD